MGKFKDLTGQKFGRLTVINRIENKKEKHATWKCVCECGNAKNVRSNNLTQGYTKSCGCFQKEKVVSTLTTSGMSRTRIYCIWKHMKDRCSNPNNEKYSYYGGKGISVCDKWLTFEGFYKDMSSGYKDDLSIDRIDGNKGYTKENCRWATRMEQSNNLSSNLMVEFDNKKDTFANFCRKYNIKLGTGKTRLNRGWSLERTLKTPILKKNSK